MIKRHETLLGMAAFTGAGLLLGAIFAHARAATSPPAKTKPAGADKADKAAKPPAEVKVKPPAAKPVGAPKAAEKPENGSEAPKDPNAPKGIFEQRPDEHYEQGDRVDPFTLGRPPKEEGPSEVPRTTPGNGVKVEPRGLWAKELKKFREAFRETDVRLSETTQDRFSKVIKDCKKHISTIEAKITQLQDQKNATDAANYLYDFQAVLEKFQSLQATAKRLQLKQEVKADFASKSIVVEGIVWRPRSPAAAVNGQMVTEGSVLRIGEKGMMIQVYRIRRHSVVFTYRGIQVAAQLQRGSL